MLDYAIMFVAFVVSVSLALNVWRLYMGPDISDRILALDTMYINSIALIIIYGIYAYTPLFFEAALLIAMLGFAGSVAFAKYLLRGDIIE